MDLHGKVVQFYRDNDIFVPVHPDDQYRTGLPVYTDLYFTAPDGFILISDAVIRAGSGHWHLPVSRPLFYEDWPVIDGFILMNGPCPECLRDGQLVPWQTLWEADSRSQKVSRYLKDKIFQLAYSQDVFVWSCLRYLLYHLCFRAHAVVGQAISDNLVDYIRNHAFDAYYFSYVSSDFRLVYAVTFSPSETRQFFPEGFPTRYPDYARIASIDEVLLMDNDDFGLRRAIAYIFAAHSMYFV